MAPSNTRPFTPQSVEMILDFSLDLETTCQQEKELIATACNETASQCKTHKAPTNRPTNHVDMQTQFSLTTSQMAAAATAAKMTAVRVGGGSTRLHGSCEKAILLFGG